MANKLRINNLPENYMFYNAYPYARKKNAGTDEFQFATELFLFKDTGAPSEKVTNGFVNMAKKAVVALGTNKDTVFINMPSSRGLAATETRWNKINGILRSNHLNVLDPSALHYTKPKAEAHAVKADGKRNMEYDVLDGLFFNCKDQIKGKHVVILDDVMTTGRHLRLIGDELRKLGAVSVSEVALCCTPPKPGHDDTRYRYHVVQDLDCQKHPHKFSETLDPSQYQGKFYSIDVRERELDLFHQAPEVKSYDQQVSNMMAAEDNATDSEKYNPEFNKKVDENILGHYEEINETLNSKYYTVEGKINFLGVLYYKSRLGEESNKLNADIKKEIGSLRKEDYNSYMYAVQKHGEVSAAILKDLHKLNPKRSAKEDDKLNQEVNTAICKYFEETAQKIDKKNEDLEYRFNNTGIFPKSLTELKAFYSELANNQTAARKMRSFFKNGASENEIKDVEKIVNPLESLESDCNKLKDNVNAIYASKLSQEEKIKQLEEALVEMESQRVYKCYSFLSKSFCQGYSKVMNLNMLTSENYRNVEDKANEYIHKLDKDPDRIVKDAKLEMRGLLKGYQLLSNDYDNLCKKRGENADIDNLIKGYDMEMSSSGIIQKRVIGLAILVVQKLRGKPFTYEEEKKYTFANAINDLKNDFKNIKPVNNNKGISKSDESTESNIINQSNNSFKKMATKKQQSEKPAKQAEQTMVLPQQVNLSYANLSPVKRKDGTDVKLTEPRFCTTIRLGDLAKMQKESGRVEVGKDGKEHKMLDLAIITNKKFQEGKNSPYIVIAQRNGAPSQYHGKDVNFVDKDAVLELTVNSAQILAKAKNILGKENLDDTVQIHIGKNGAGATGVTFNPAEYPTVEKKDLELSAMVRTVNAFDRTLKSQQNMDRVEPNRYVDKYLGSAFGFEVKDANKQPVLNEKSQEPIMAYNITLKATDIKFLPEADKFGNINLAIVKRDLSPEKLAEKGLHMVADSNYPVNEKGFKQPNYMVVADPKTYKNGEPNEHAVAVIKINKAELNALPKTHEQFTTKDGKEVNNDYIHISTDRFAQVNVNTRDYQMQNVVANEQKLTAHITNYNPEVAKKERQSWEQKNPRLSETDFAAKVEKEKEMPTQYDAYRQAVQQAQGKAKEQKEEQKEEQPAAQQTKQFKDYSKEENQTEKKTKSKSMPF